jgi:acetylornithine deacetylase
VSDLVDDLAALVRVPSFTGDELGAFEVCRDIATRLGLQAEIVEHDLAALRAHPDHPGEEAPRAALHGLTVTRPGNTKRLALNGHVDVVGVGTEAWQHADPFSAAVEHGRLYGRGSVDMKAGVIAALHAMCAATTDVEVVLHVVGSEEDGGLGTFAALQNDADFHAALIPEPTGFDVVCAQAGALTFTGTVRGRAAHAAERLEGESAIDRYVEIHQRLQRLEDSINEGVTHPLMRELRLPYPINVGKLRAGEWSSSVPDHLTFEGRVGVPVGASPAEIMARTEAAADGATLEWTGGKFHPGETAHDHPFVDAVVRAVHAEGKSGSLAGVPWGADMRLYTARGIPAVMVGTTGIERAHAVDEWVDLDEVATVSRIIRRVIETF